MEYLNKQINIRFYSISTWCYTNINLTDIFMYYINI